MSSLLIHTLAILWFNVLWLYQRKWEGYKEIYGFNKEPYDDMQKFLIKFVWFYSLSGLLTLLLYLYKTFQ